MAENSGDGYPFQSLIITDFIPTWLGFSASVTKRSSLASFLLRRYCSETLTRIFVPMRKRKGEEINNFMELRWTR